MKGASAEASIVVLSSRYSPESVAAMPRLSYEVVDDFALSSLAEPLL
jgi:hypothetical protein